MSRLPLRWLPPIDNSTAWDGHAINDQANDSLWPNRPVYSHTPSHFILVLSIYELSADSARRFSSRERPFPINGYARDSKYVLFLEVQAIEGLHGTCHPVLKSYDISPEAPDRFFPSSQRLTNSLALRWKCRSNRISTCNQVHEHDLSALPTASRPVKIYLEFCNGGIDDMNVIDADMPRPETAWKSLSVSWSDLILINRKCGDRVKKWKMDVSEKLFIWRSIQSASTSLPIFFLKFTRARNYGDAPEWEVSMA
jgi:hypothetical protein